MVIQRLLLLLLWFWLSNNSLKWKPVIVRREFVQLCCGSTLLYAAVVSVNRLTTWCMLSIASSHCILAVSRDFYPKIHRRLEWNWNDWTCSGQVDLTAATLGSIVELCAWASAHRDKWVNWMGGEVIRVGQELMIIIIVIIIDHYPSSRVSLLKFSKCSSSPVARGHWPP